MRGFSLTLLFVGLTSLAISSTAAPYDGALTYRDSGFVDGHVVLASSEARKTTGAVNIEESSQAGISRSASVAISSSPAPYVFAKSQALNQFGSLDYSARGELSYEFLITGVENSIVGLSVASYFALEMKPDTELAGQIIRASAMAFVNNAATTFSAEWDAVAGGVVYSSWLAPDDATAYELSGVAQPGLLNWEGIALFKTSVQLNSAGYYKGTVQLRAESYVFNNGGVGGSWASALVDPRLEIAVDSSSSAALAILTLPLGVGNDLTVSAVPEPGTNLLMAVGLIFLLAGRRRSSSGILLVFGLHPASIVCSVRRLKFWRGLAVGQSIT